jgi:nicotinate-nucleotide--dimethylbenzimidazole phosphoribosyltransferase
MTASPSPAASLAEIRSLLSGLPGPSPTARAAAAAREATLTKPPGALGRLEELAAWMAVWQDRHPPALRRPRVAVFAGNHGVATRGVSAYPPAVTAQMVANFVAGGGAVNQICRSVDADLRVYELSLETPTADFTAGPAMADGDCARAMAYGMMAVEQGVDLVALGEMGIANTTAASALCLALFGGEAGDWTGPGTGVDGDRLAVKRATVAAGAALHAGAGDGLEMLRRLGGFEFAAIAGAVVAARVARVPVLLDGFAATAAAAALHAVDPTLLDHCQVAHLSAEPAHARLCAAIGKRPLLDLGMRLGEASGAALAIGLVRAAVACHAGMASFADAGVSGPA